MVLHKLETRADFNNPKLQKNYKRFDFLINELHGHDLSRKSMTLINQCIDAINNTQEESTLLRLIRGSQNKIVRNLTKTHGIVPKGYYKKLWTILGISAVGLPAGVILGLILNSMDFVWVGWVISFIICFRVGKSKDREVSKFGRQLNFKSKA